MKQGHWRDQRVELPLVQLRAGAIHDRRAAAAHTAYQKSRQSSVVMPNNPKPRHSPSNTSDDAWPGALKNLDRTFVFIDGGHLSTVSHALGFTVDFKALRCAFARHCGLVRAHYYTVARRDGDDVPLQRLLDWLDYNGFRVTSQIVDGDSPSQFGRAQRILNVALAVDVMRTLPTCRHVVLIAGTPEFERLILSIRELGPKTTVISSLSGANLVADGLRRAADHFVDMSELRAALELPASAQHSRNNRSGEGPSGE